jgi:3-hydroxymyristoyl/3-hydroxydecanoyl-(acyl carrier protein) dehydratase
VTELARQIRAARSLPDTSGADGALTGHFCFRPGFLGFQGHFPGRPILPAFVQVATALTMVQDALGRPLALTALDRARFRRPVSPDTPLTVTCLPQDGGRFAVRVTAGDQAVAGFTITVEAAPPPGNPP